MKVAENLLIDLGNGLSLEVVIALLDTAVELERNARSLGVVVVWLSEDVDEVQVVETAQCVCLCLYLVYVLLCILHLWDVIQYGVGAKDDLIVALIHVYVSGAGFLHHLEHVGLPCEARKVEVAVESLVGNLVRSRLHVIIKQSKENVESLHIITLVSLAQKQLVERDCIFWYELALRVRLKEITAGCK